MANALLTVRTVSDLRAVISGWRMAGQRVGFVPTMGALHEGHLSLVDIALANADRIVASIFVNPTQFGPNEDFEKYPRTEAEDAAMLAGRSCDLLWAPSAAEMYPDGFATEVRVGGLTDILCGADRPGHFNGVTTIVSKLFNQVQPDIAVFGEKDFQQLQVIRRMAADLNLKVRVLSGPTVREADGLAMSSRNRRLTPQQRAVAARLNVVLRAAAEALAGGAAEDEVLMEGTEALVRAGFDRVDYLEARMETDLAALESHSGPARVLAAARLDDVRLIDNWKFTRPPAR
jgi:pantoate--beta-alanine ligase